MRAREKTRDRKRHRSIAC